MCLFLPVAQFFLLSMMFCFSLRLYCIFLSSAFSLFVDISFSSTILSFLLLYFFPLWYYLFFSDISFSSPILSFPLRYFLLSLRYYLLFSDIIFSSPILFFLLRYWIFLSDISFPFLIFFSPEFFGPLIFLFWLFFSVHFVIILLTIFIYFLISFLFLFYLSTNCLASQTKKPVWSWSLCFSSMCLLPWSKTKNSSWTDHNMLGKVTVKSAAIKLPVQLDHTSELTEESDDDNDCNDVVVCHLLTYTCLLHVPFTSHVTLRQLGSQATTWLGNVSRDLATCHVTADHVVPWLHRLFLRRYRNFRGAARSHSLCVH